MAGRKANKILLKNAKDVRTSEQIAKDIFIDNYVNNLKKSDVFVLGGEVGGNASFDGKKAFIQDVKVGKKTAAKDFTAVINSASGNGFEANNESIKASREARVSWLKAGQSAVEAVVGKPLEFVSEVFKTGTISIDAANKMALGLGKGAGVFVEKTLEGMAEIAKESGIGIANIETAAFDASGKAIESVGSFLETSLKCGGQIIYGTCKVVNEGVLQSSAKIISSSGQALGTIITTGANVIESTKNSASNLLKGTSDFVTNSAVGFGNIVEGIGDGISDNIEAVGRFNKASFGAIGTSIRNSQRKKDIEHYENRAVDVLVEEGKLHKAAIKTSEEYKWTGPDGRTWTRYSKEGYNSARGRLEDQRNRISNYNKGR